MDISNQIQFRFYFFILLALVHFPTPVLTASVLGVGSCASSGCHGGTTSSTRSRVQQNEFTIWARKDPHSRAFENLKGERGLAIAKNLGLKSPQEASECLICHSTWISKTTHRGPRFQLEDGVGCESCHGGAENYLSTHARSEISYQRNIESGMIDLRNPVVRAQLCLNCHLGDHDIASHALYAAGHPRMSFELDTYSVIQPAHFRVDTDYIDRKGKVSPIAYWLAGQWFRAEGLLKMAEKNPKDFAHLECLSCHHSLNENRWRFIAPGVNTPPANQSSLLMVSSAFAEGEVINLTLLQKERGRLSKTLYSKDESLHLLRRLIQISRSGPVVASYENAEQIAMALTILLDESGLRSQHQKSLDQLFDELVDPSRYRPSKFLETLNRIKI